MKTTISVSLNTDEHADILRWLARQENISQAIRDAVRAQIRGEVTVADVYQAVRDLQRRLEAGAVVVQQADADGCEEPPDVAAALDALGEVT